jgi:hypothetical protein
MMAYLSPLMAFDFSELSAQPKIRRIHERMIQAATTVQMKRVAQ